MIESSSIDFTNLLSRLTDYQHRQILTNMNEYPVDSTLPYYTRLYNALLELDFIDEPHADDCTCINHLDPDYPEGLTD